MSQLADNQFEQLPRLPQAELAVWPEGDGEGSCRGEQEGHGGGQGEEQGRRGPGPGQGGGRQGGATRQVEETDGGIVSSCSREAQAPPDILGKGYFEDTRRFKIDKDPRDPIYDNVKREDGAVNWRGFVEEGIANARQARDGIKSGSPFRAEQGELRRDGSMDYVRYDWGGKGLMALVAGFFILMAMEARETYLDNVENVAVERGLIEKRFRTASTDPK